MVASAPADLLWVAGRTPGHSPVAVDALAETGSPALERALGQVTEPHLDLVGAENRPDGFPAPSSLPARPQNSSCVIAAATSAAQRAEHPSRRGAPRHTLPVSLAAA